MYIYKENQWWDVTDKLLIKNHEKKVVKIIYIVFNVRKITVLVNVCLVDQLYRLSGRTLQLEHL